MTGHRIERQLSMATRRECGTGPRKESGAFSPTLITTQYLEVNKSAVLSLAEADTLPIAGVTTWLGW